MPWLFRAFSDESQGTHRPDLIAPGAADGQADWAAMIPNEDMKQIIEDALAWKKTSGNEFIFLTTSLLFALQTALFRAQKGQNVRILCINTKTARAVDGSAVKFDYMPALKREYGVDLRNNDGSPQDHSEVYVTMECFVPGKDSLIAKLEDLESNLYKLYPALEGSWRSHRPRLNLVVQDMRKFHFETERGLTIGQLTVASKAAASFVALHGAATGPETIPMQVLIPLLALQKRPQSDLTLIQWLDQNSVATLDGVMYRNVEVEECTLPEIAEANRLAVYFQGREIVHSVLTSNASITAAESHGEWRSWEVWRRESRDAHRKARDAGNRGADRKTRKCAKASHPEGSAGRRNHTTDDRRRTRGGKAWLPRAEYEMRIASRYGQKETGAGTGGLLHNRKRRRDELEGSDHEGSYPKLQRRDVSGRRPRRF